jgi:hypothetical protein
VEKKREVGKGEEKQVKWRKKQSLNHSDFEKIGHKLVGPGYQSFH